MNQSNFTTSSILNDKKLLGILFSIVIVSLVIRLYYFDSELPLTLDSLGYFLYAKEIDVTGSLPYDQSTQNNGWPLFISWVLEFVNTDNIIFEMQLQKVSSILFSVMTIFLVYLLCKKFFNNSLSLVGSSLFAFEPRLIYNSIQGITEPLFIFLSTLTLVLFLNQNKKITYLSFFVVAIVSMVRAEGIFLFFIISILFIIRFRNEKWVIPKTLISISIFFITFIPIAIQRFEYLGNDAVFGRVAKGIERSSNSGTPFILEGIENFIKFLGWDLIPIFIIFVPIGFFLIFKNRDFGMITILVSLVGFSLPALYAYAIPALDTRYLFILYPIFCVISLYTINKINQKIKSKYFLLALVIVILITSIVFLEIKLSDYNHQKESLLIAMEITKEPSGINSYYPESVFIEPVGIIKNWDVWKDYFLIEKEFGKPTRNVFPHEIIIFPVDNSENLNEYIEKFKSQGLTKIIVDDTPNRQVFLNDIFHNESNYPYLIKEYDSKNEGLEYHVKIFKIDYLKYSKYSE